MTTLKMYRYASTKNYAEKTNAETATNAATSDKTVTSNNIATEISMTENCVKRLQEIQRQEKCVLRVAVEGGGCSGFQYMFSLDIKPEKDDYILQDGGVSVAIDSMSLEFLRGATIDYQKELIRSSFRIVQNPKAEKGCSCGASFAIKI